MRKFLTGVVLALIVMLIVWFFLPGIEKITIRALPTPYIVVNSGEADPVVIATAIADEVTVKPTIPAPIIRTFGDETALRTQLAMMKGEHTEITTNIHNISVPGEATASQIVKLGIDMLYWTYPFTMSYRAVYSVTIHGGTNDETFWGTAVTQVGSWQDKVTIDPTTGGQIITRTAEITVTMTLPVCITSIEKNEGDSHTLPIEVPSDEVIYLAEKTGNPFKPDVLRTTAETEARKDALSEENIAWLYNLVAADVSPGGHFYEWLKNVVLADKFGFREINLTIAVDPNQKVRCDGTPVQ